MDDLTVYSMGLCYASVCTTLPDAEATSRMNLEHMPGTSHGWQIADEPFRNGDPNGRPCDQRPASHRHLLFEC